MELTSRQELTIICALIGYRNQCNEMLKTDNDQLFETYLEHIWYIDEIIDILNDSYEQSYNH